MSVPVIEPSPRLKLLRFAVRALRISASTVAVVALLRQQWLAGSALALAWLLIAAAPLLFPQLEPERSASSGTEPPGQ
jgi:hypothetical protein